MVLCYFYLNPCFGNFLIKKDMFLKNDAQFTTEKTSKYNIVLDKGKGRKYSSVTDKIFRKLSLVKTF